jgi:NAD(P)-dependent dehydrogenase (short-subunit alcohol dehydrogenase family)
MSLRLEGKVAVVTGAGRDAGLGAAIARRLAADGAAVVISDLGHVTSDGSNLGDAAGLRAVAASIAKAGGRSLDCPGDVTSLSEMRALAARAVSSFGRLDIWINNAGIGFKMTPLLELDADDWRSVIDVNLTGCFNGLRAAAEIMVAQGQGGRIVNIASQAAKSGFPFAQAYCASKHGVVGLTRSAAIELGAHAITVNAVCPNHVTTGLGAWQNDYFAAMTGRTVEAYLADMRARIPLGRVGLAGDTAAAVSFLASDDAAYITAESMNVSGGEEPH